MCLPLAENKTNFEDLSGCCVGPQRTGGGTAGIRMGAGKPGRRNGPVLFGELRPGYGAVGI